MNYSNLLILKELKSIDKCLNSYSQEEKEIETMRKCIYTDINSGIISYLCENKLISMNKMHDGTILPFISPY